MLVIYTHLIRVRPAAFTLFTVRLCNCKGNALKIAFIFTKLCALLDRSFRNDKDSRQLGGYICKLRIHITVGIKPYCGFKRSADDLFRSFNLQSFFSVLSYLFYQIPLFHKLVAYRNTALHRHIVKENTLRIIAVKLGEVRPNLFGGKRKDRRNKSGNSGKNGVNYSLGRSSFLRIRLFTVQSVLDDVKIEI